MDEGEWGYESLFFLSLSLSVLLSLLGGCGCLLNSENEAHMLRCVRSMFDQKGLDRLQAVEEEIQRERETEYRRQDLAYRRELLRKSLQKGLAIV